MLEGQLYEIPVVVPPTERRVVVLGIESTSHTFGVGVLEFKSGRVRVLANKSSHYKPEKGGIHPSEAAQHHVNAAHSVIKSALEEAGLTLRGVDVVAVAVGPGLGPCLRVGATVARFLSAYWNKPLVPVNHAVAHIEIGKLAGGMRDPLVVYVSGGNTLIAVQKDKRYRVLGETLDIPLGNLLDTFTREIGIAPPYVVNGKHAIDICAEWSSEFTPLPYTVKGADLSFSGLLTAALRIAREAGSSRSRLGRVCNSLRETAFNMLLEVVERSLMLTGKREVLLVGGVASNTILREKFEALAGFYGVKYYGTPPEIAGDNGLMIAYTGLLQYLYGRLVEPENLVVRQRFRLDEETYPWLS
jgi:N6-L-threonylcarbamoyladenine synthase